jgi:hypothetical protein
MITFKGSIVNKINTTKVPSVRNPHHGIQMQKANIFKEFDTPK